MISAVIGEEFGLIGIIAIVVIFGLFGYAGFQIAKNARDEYGRILAQPDRVDPGPGIAQPLRRARRR
jgi:hypothetical protein